MNKKDILLSLFGILMKGDTYSGIFHTPVDSPSIIEEDAQGVGHGGRVSRKHRKGWRGSSQDTDGAYDS